MNQPDANPAVPPNPARAEALQKLQIPDTTSFWAAFRDHELNAAENGVPKARVASYTAEVVDKLVDAQLDTIAVLLNLQKGFTEAMQTSQPPNPQLAGAVRNADILPNWKSSVALREHLIDIYENGIPPGKLFGFLATLLEKTSLALLETIVWANLHDDAIKGVARVVDSLSARVSALEQR